MSTLICPSSSSTFAGVTHTFGLFLRLFVEVLVLVDARSLLPLQVLAHVVEQLVARADLLQLAPLVRRVNQEVLRLPLRLAQPRQVRLQLLQLLRQLAADPAVTSPTPPRGPLF